VKENLIFHDVPKIPERFCALGLSRSMNPLDARAELRELLSMHS